MEDFRGLAQPHCHEVPLPGRMSNLTDDITYLDRARALRDAAKLSSAKLGFTYPGTTRSIHCQYDPDPDAAATPPKPIRFVNGRDVVLDARGRHAVKTLYAGCCGSNSGVSLFRWPKCAISNKSLVAMKCSTAIIVTAIQNHQCAICFSGWRNSGLD